MRSINVISATGDAVMLAIEAHCAHFHRVGSLAELRELLLTLPASDPPEPVTLDLLGHSGSAAKLFQLGSSTINPCDRRVDLFFRDLARDRVLARLGVVALRLIGCETAVTPGGQYTLRRLAATLHIPVFGTTKMIMKSHYTAGGFDPRFARILAEAATLPTEHRRWVEAQRQAAAAAIPNETAMACSG